MKKLFLKDVLEKINGKTICGDADSEITDVSIDTRTLKKGDTYFALQGENVDGTIFCKDAIKKGAKICFLQKNIFSDDELNQFGANATIVLVKNVEDALVEVAKIKRNLYDIPVVAITGSVGKTSTKDVIYSVMAKKFNVHKTQGNQNNRLGVPLTIMSLKDHDALVIELGMNHFGELSELTNIVKPTMCVITNIGSSHIGNLGSREGILKAKLEILEGLSKNGKVIINNDNDLLHKWNLQDKDYTKVTFGIKEKSDFMARNIKMKEFGNEFTLTLDNQDFIYKTNKAGEPFVLNALSAIAVGTEYGIEPEKMQDAIANGEIAKNRMDIEKKNGILVVKDYYNASFESIKPSLEYIAALDGGKKIAVLGDIKEVGDYSKQIHVKVGREVVKNNIDILITVGIDARYIAESALKHGMSEKNVFIYNNNLQAIKKLKEIVEKDDKVLIKASNSMNFKEIYDGMFRKLKLAVIAGGMSSEHDISLISAQSILSKINKEKYDIKVVVIKRNGNVYEYIGPIEELTNIKTSNLIYKNNFMNEVEDADIVFPVLHGKYGEDGCIQGALETMQKPYVGCNVFASAACLDKEFTKKLVSLAGIPVANGIVVRKINHHYLCDLDEKEYSKDEICNIAENKLGFPMFIKPAREGSSFGVTRACNKTELIDSINEALRYDNKILIEEEIVGRELECAVLGNTEVVSAEVGEVLSAEGFYTFDAKYNNQESKTDIPAKIKPEEREKVKRFSEKAFKAINGTGLSRVDFFLSKDGEVILNEINTLPGFTKISMYPKLFEAVGMSYSELIDNLINLAIDK